MFSFVVKLARNAHAVGAPGPFGAKPTSYGGSPGLRQTFPKHDNHHIRMHACDLRLAQSFSYGFLGGPVAIRSNRTNKKKAHTKREPKRIYQSRDTSEISPYIVFLGLGLLSSLAELYLLMLV